MGFVSLKKYVTALLELLSFTITERNSRGGSGGGEKKAKEIKLDPGCHLQTNTSTAHSHSIVCGDISRQQQREGQNVQL